MSAVLLYLNVKSVEQCAASGAGAVVLKSISRSRSCTMRLRWMPYPIRLTAMRRFICSVIWARDYKAGFLRLVQESRSKTDLPVIASINCVADKGDWIEYATAMADAGASALELNIFIQPTDIHAQARELELNYAEIVGRVAGAVKIPRFGETAHAPDQCLRLVERFARLRGPGVVFFNRFFEPDVDVERMTFVESSPYSEPTELRNVLRMVAICSAVLPQLDLSVSTGVHDGEAAVKALLCGAEAVQVCTAIHQKGFEVIAEMNEYIDRWSERQGFGSLDEFRGRLNFKNDTSAMFQRVQYMKYFPSEAK